MRWKGDEKRGKGFEAGRTMRLAVYNFGMFAKASLHPENDDFHFLNDLILPQVDKAAGLVGRSGYDGEPGPKSWGTQVYPRFYQEQGDGWAPSTLSLWLDLESAMAFSYFGLHASALKRGREWFVKPQWPPYVLWWVEDAETPEWKDAVVRHEYLNDHGPSAHAFTFKQAFDPAGNPLAVDHAKIKAVASQNAAILGAKS